MPLKPDDLADAMETAFKQAWPEIKGTPLPPADPKDRRVLFVAVARGLLTYLQQNPTEILTTLVVDDPLGATLTYTVQEADVNADLS
jgi:hypothetical protein